ncbi:L,D-transpeptidase family protein [Vibrio artabrorum]|uniref:L,D-transpeptidase family protein n=1 Tax=Vibrio artabrorum TaxID=446374 RepID=UPI00355828D0
MHLFLFLCAYLMWSMQVACAETSPTFEASIDGKTLIVEKIISDATAIETIVFEHIALGSQKTSHRILSPPDADSIKASSRHVVTLVRVDKSKRRMYLLKGEEVIQEYRIALGKQPKGHKRFEGDNRTPEGEYQLDYVMEESNFYRSVHINYPQPSDMQWAEQNGVDPGGNIKIHGIKNGERRSPNFIQSFDWTDGCIALTNQDMDEFLKLVKMGTPIHIEW